MNRRAIEEAIADINARLKGPLGNLERAMMVADRKELREKEALLDAKYEAAAAAPHESKEG